jgi:hypothetical protein
MSIKATSRIELAQGPFSIFLRLAACSRAVFIMHGQLWHGLVAIATLGSCALANPLGYRIGPGNSSVNIDRLMMRDDTEEFDPSDLSFIKTMAAVGDSYSAGIGAGSRLGSLLDTGGNSLPFCLKDESC